MRNRKFTKQIFIGGVPVGGCAPVTVQSMTNTDTADVPSTMAQIRALAKAGCQLVRMAVPDENAVRALSELKKQSPVPLIADIHFDYRLALGAIRAGMDEIRINPGNIGSPDRVKKVVEAAGEACIPLRVGANAGSLPKGLLDSLLKKGLSRPEAVSEALVLAAEQQIELLESYHFDRIKVSLKASSVPVTVDACRRFSARSDYPLHIGVTEAGTTEQGILKSAVGIGALLLDGIGDTIRVSLTADPVEEVRAGIAILEAAGLRDPYPEVTSCPTCGRTKYDMIPLARAIGDFVREKKASGHEFRIRKIAVMGCAVNGPGEASDAELGIAGGPPGKLFLFRHGEVTETISEGDALERMKQEILFYMD